MRKSHLSGLITVLLAALPVVAGAGRAIYVPSREAHNIARGVLNAKPGDTVIVKDGVYRERIAVEPGVILKSQNQYGAVIDGKGRGTVVTLSKGSVLDGFEVRNGTIGVFSKDPNARIKNCRIIRNWQTGIIVVRHLPWIEDNVIAFNRGSGIQGWDVRTTGPSINHNSIAFNGNHGISVGGGSKVIVEKNIIAYNERFGVKLQAEVEQATVKANAFYENLWSSTPLPDGNYQYDPMFADPRASLDFTVTAKKTCSDCPLDDPPGARFPTLTSSSRY